MVPVLKLLLSVGFSAILITALGQNPKSAKSSPATVQKFKPPKLTSSLGLRSDSATVVVEEALQLIRLPLKITDDKKNAYTISSYQVIYKRRAVTEDEATGKVSPTTSTVAQLFRETPLPELWKNIMTEQLRTGEEIFFFDVIAKDAQGRFMFAPDLKLKIK
jgi:hypothetical protein